MEGLATRHGDHLDAQSKVHIARANRKQCFGRMKIPSMGKLTPVKVLRESRPCFVVMASSKPSPWQ